MEDALLFHDPEFDEEEPQPLVAAGILPQPEVLDDSPPLIMIGGTSTMRDPLDRSRDPSRDTIGLFSHRKHGSMKNGKSSPEKYMKCLMQRNISQTTQILLRTLNVTILYFQVTFRDRRPWRHLLPSRYCHMIFMHSQPYLQTQYILRIDFHWSFDDIGFT